MKFQLPWEDNIYDCEWVEETNFEDLANVSSILGFIFDDNGHICIVDFKDKKDWTLPGGHIEDYDENFEACLIREVEEEADLELKDIKRIGYMSGLKQGDPKEKINHQLRYVALVHKIKEQTIDPAEGYIPGRKFIHPDEFIEHTKWHYGGKEQLKKAIEILGEME